MHEFITTVIIGGMKTVNSHMKVLVAAKELRERRKLGIRVIVAETGASRSAVQRLLNNSIKQVPLDDLAKLCDWIPCAVGELLRLEELPDMPAPEPRRTSRQRAADGSYAPEGGAA